METKKIRNTKGKIAIDIVSNYLTKRGYIAGLTPLEVGADIIVYKDGATDYYILVRAYDEMRYFSAYMISIALYSHCMNLYKKLYDPLYLYIVDYVAGAILSIRVNEYLSESFIPHDHSDRFHKLDSKHMSFVTALSTADRELLKKFTSTTDIYKP